MTSAILGKWDILFRSHMKQLCLPVSAKDGLMSESNDPMSESNDPTSESNDHDQMEHVTQIVFPRLHKYNGTDWLVGITD